MGLLAAVRPTAGSETNIYTVPSGKKAVVNVTIMNADSASAIIFSLGVQAVAGNFVPKDYVFKDRVLSANSDPIQMTGLVLTSGNSIRALTTGDGLNVHVNGVEESA